MIDLKQATQIALQYLKELYELSENVRLEEIGLTDDECYGLITFSFVEASNSSLIPNLKQRQYKIFKVKIDTGQVMSMKIREFPATLPADFVLPQFGAV